MESLKNYTILGVCAGNGVVLYPFKKHLVGNIEYRSVFKTPLDEQWEANFDPRLLYNNNKAVPSKPSNILAIIGHPDCGHSSVLAYSRGKKLSDPKENKSLTLYITMVELQKPKLFLMENLPALLKTYGKKDLKEAFKDYNLKFIQGSVDLWGNSQRTRKRLVVIGIRKDQHPRLIKQFKLPRIEGSELKCFGDLIRDLKEHREENCHVRLPLSTNIAIYGGRKMTLKEIKETWLNMESHQSRFPANKERMKYAPGVYRNLRDEYPMTVRKGNREFDHNGNVLTPRQRARIQGIPDSFKLIYHNTKPNFYITKANITATKCFPYEISLWFKRRLERAIKNKLLTT